MRDAALPLPSSSSSASSSTTFRRYLSSLPNLPLPPRVRRLALPTALLSLLLLAYLLFSPTPTAFHELSPNPYYTQPEFPEDPHADTLPLIPPSFAPYFESCYPSLPPAFHLAHHLNLAIWLHMFLQRPVSAYDHPGKFDRCAKERADELVNRDQYRGNVEAWKGIDEDEIRKRRAEIVWSLEKRIRDGETVVGPHGKGRGIVMTGGNKVGDVRIWGALPSLSISLGGPMAPLTKPPSRAISQSRADSSADLQDTTARTLSSIRHMRRHLGVTLPIEVFYFPGEITAQNERDEFVQLGAKLVEVKSISKAEGVWKVSGASAR